MKDKLIVLIDADDTLLDFQACEKNAIKEVGKMLGVEDVPKFTMDYHEVNKQVWKEFEQGLLTVEQINYVRFDRIFEKYNITGKDSLQTGNYYKEELSKQAIMIDGAREFLESASKKFRMSIVTNGITYTQTRRFKKADLNKYFEHVFVSEKIGVRKPQKEFFDYVEKTLENFDINNAVLVGDSLSSDIAGGRNSGIRTIWFNNNHSKNDTDIVPTYEVDNYDDLMNILDKMAQNN